MEINDVLYGRNVVNEAVIDELINSKSFQRLKNISQFGPPDEFYHFVSFSRYEHSIGTFLLLRKFDATLEEQIAGLLHDVSHTAFSHLIDWVNGDTSKENHQDENHSNYLSKSELPKILDKYFFDVKRISEPSNYTLLEDNSRGLCADRLDYSLREILSWVDKDLPYVFLNSLINHEGHFAFKSKDTAENFARTFLRLHNEHWGSKETVLRYVLFSKALRIGLEKGIIDFQDFYKDDQYVLTKLKMSNEPQINSLFNTLKGKLQFKESNGPNSIRLPIKKFRYVDPLYLKDSQLVKLTDTSSSYRDFLEEQRKINSQPVFLELIYNV